MSLFKRETAEKTSFGIRAKLTAIVGLGTVLICAFAFTSQYFSQLKLVRQIQMEHGLLVTDVLTGQMAGPIHFRDLTRVNDVLRPVIENDASILGVDIYDGSGALLSQFDREDSRSSDLQADFEQTRRVRAQAGGVVEEFRHSYMLAAAPIMSSRGDVQLGEIVIAWNSDEARHAMLAQTIRTSLLGAGIAVIVLIVVMLVIGRTITSPVQALSAAMRSVSQHDFDVEIPAQSRKDEIGDMANRLAQFRDSLAEEETHRNLREAEAAQRQELFQALAEGLSDLADGQVEQSIDASRFDGLDDDHKTICANFNEVIEKLRTVLTTISSTAESVRNSSAEIADVAVDQSKRSEAQAVMLEESAAAIETLSASVDQIAERAAEANDRILQNRKQAQSGGEVVGLTVEAMKNIEQSSEQITAIIGVIDDIAFQTNLLALNAGVEAARAGEAGRGFAVVASEVRALAQRASESANEIKELILRSGEQVTNGSALVNKAGASLNEIIDGVNYASDLVSQIATGSREQANNLAEIKSSVSELDRVTQQNAAVIEESSAASRSLSEEAARMTEVMTAFHLPSTSTDNAIETWDEDLAADQARPDDAPTPEPSQAPASPPRPPEKLAVNDGDGWHEF